MRCDYKKFFANHDHRLQLTKLCLTTQMAALPFRAHYLGFFEKKKKKKKELIFTSVRVWTLQSVLQYYFLVFSEYVVTSHVLFILVVVPFRERLVLSVNLHISEKSVRIKRKCLFVQIKTKTNPRNEQRTRKGRQQRIMRAPLASRVFHVSHTGSLYRFLIKLSI